MLFTMQVKLTPTQSQDSPMTFELDKNSSLILGGVESQAELSWDLLESNFSITFKSDDSLLFLEPQPGNVLTANGQTITSRYQATSRDILELGNLQCTLEIQMASDQDSSSETLSQEDEVVPTDSFQDPSNAPKAAFHHSSDDDIFQASSEASPKSFDSGFNKPVSINIESSRWLFKVLTGPNAGAQMGLEETKVYTIGSDTHCDIVLTDLSVSKQHLTLTVLKSGEITVQDLKSRNGVLMNGEKIEDKASQTSSTIITAGATTFMVVDRTSEQKTIVTPALPMKERAFMEKMVETSAQTAQKNFGDVQSKKPEVPAKKKSYVTWAAVAITSLAIAVGLFSLFNTKLIVNHVQPRQVQDIAAILEEYPTFDYNFNPATGVLVLNGHILTEKDKRQLLSKLSQISAVQRTDDTNLVVDELVWQQFNMAIEKNFKGISLSAISPGAFVLSGTIDSQTQAENLNRYLRLNFPYNETLQNKVVVFEQFLSSINQKLQSIAPGELVAELNQGDLIFVGTVPNSKSAEFQELVEKAKVTPGIRNVRNMVVEQNSSDESGLMDVSQNYQVTGFSKSADANSSVMIKGRILRRGDQLDGMTITSIRARVIILERDGIKYRINYNS
jgi:type III secretion system YscD/HrpQ family protein